MTPTSVFTLGRMRQLDLLALWLGTDAGRDSDIAKVATFSKERLIAMITAAPAPRLPRYKRKT